MHNYLENKLENTNLITDSNSLNQLITIINKYKQGDDKALLDFIQKKQVPLKKPIE